MLIGLIVRCIVDCNLTFMVVVKQATFCYNCSNGSEGNIVIDDTGHHQSYKQASMPYSEGYVCSKPVTCTLGVAAMAVKVRLLELVNLQSPYKQPSLPNSEGYVCSNL